MEESLIQELQSKVESLQQEVSVLQQRLIVLESQQPVKACSCRRAFDSVKDASCSGMTQQAGCITIKSSS
jgi:hypothetical protein